MPFGRWTTLSDEARDLSAGVHLRTLAGSRAGILLANGISVRLAEASELVLESTSRVRLVVGKVYLDTADRAVDASAIEVITALGIASDIGTQFEVLYRDDAYRLRVREGRVVLSRSSTYIDNRAGDQLTIGADGILQRTRISRQDAEWDWIESVAPALEIDEQPLSVLLTWVARETGRSIRFATPGIESKANTTILHGNIRALAPLEALTVMLATTDLEHTILDDGTILIGLKVNR
jgi:ferric-dicitrate binding protein FerR (iron transport regulator)